MRPGDRATVCASATYVSVLVRSHLRNLAPLPKEELLALKRSVAELGTIGRNLNQIARAANQGGKPAGPGREDLKAMLRVAEGLRDHVKALLRANQISLGAGTCREHSLTSGARDRFSTSQAMPRRGPGRRDRLSHDEIELIARTVRRTPEVMVKVLSRGGQDLKAIGRHLGYLDRGGEVEIETDDGQHLLGKGVEKELAAKTGIWTWKSIGARPISNRGRIEPPPKLVHKLMFSMPAGTPPDKVLSAVKNFAREEFALKHRYAMVLHTDEPHPHVHMVVKAMSEQGVRLNIRKATLREWRREFARHLRALGVAANATDRSARGESRSPKLDGIYRAERRGESRHADARAESRGGRSLEGESAGGGGQGKIARDA